MGLRYTNSGEKVETGDKSGFFKKAWSGTKNLLGMAVEHEYPNVYEKWMNRKNSKNEGEMVYNQGDIGSYQGPAEFDANYFNQNAINFGDNNIVDNSVVDQKDEFDKKVNVLDIVEDIDKGGSGKRIANQVRRENNLGNNSGDDIINDMLGYAMANMFGGWGGPKRNAYRIPMMNSSKRGLKY